MDYSPVMSKDKSENRKLGKNRIAATYAAQQSCPECPFKSQDGEKLGSRGCYAEQGLMAIHTGRMNRAATSMSPQAIADLEASHIDKLSGKRPLRLHVVGDCSTDDAARTVADASERYTARGGNPVWSYTHAWDTVNRTSWGKVSILASTETLADAGRAMARGYAACIVVSKFDGDKATKRDGVTMIPCPEQTGRAASCADCGLCFNATALHARRAVIAFEAHGQRTANMTTIRPMGGC